MVERVQLGPCSAKQEMILKSDAHITIIGGAAGSGKSYLLNMIPLRYVDCPKWRGVVLRRTTVQIRGPGGMWDTACEIYRSLDKSDQPKIKQYDLKCTFPSGAQIKFGHIEHEKNIYDYQGLQMSYLAFDEGTHFTYKMFEYLALSRMRSSSKYSTRVVVSCNPDPDSWILDLIDGFHIDEDGYPIKENDGKVRWFIVRDGTYRWFNTEAEVYEKYGDGPEIRPLSFTFISADIYDNPILIENSPEYLASLHSLNEIDKARLLYGNWKLRPLGANYFQRGWLQDTNSIPQNSVMCRAWDKASTRPSDINPSPDFTACIKMYKCINGYFYVVGDYHDEVYDEESQTYGRFREQPGKRDSLILKQAEHDGNICPIVLPQDPGSAGVTEFQSSAKALTSAGFIVKKDPMPPISSKLTRFEPFSSAAENGIVFILPHTFSKNTLELWYKELESFNGERSTQTKKDDWVDSTSSAFNHLARQRVLSGIKILSGGRNGRIDNLRKAVG